MNTLRRGGWLAALLIFAGLAAGAARLLDAQAGPGITAAAQKFLASLDDAQRKTATMSFDDPARLKWHFIPLAERKGVQVKHMNARQRAAALALLQAAMSELGYQKATTIMSLEEILRELEKSRAGGPIRDPERYYFTIFGEPKNEGAWGWSIEGHHLSLNFVVRDGHLDSHTPAMMGANPATVMRHIAGGPAEGIRVLAQEEQLAFDLIHALSADQRKTAVIAETAPKEVRAAGEPQPPQDAPEGIAAKALSATQAETLRALITAYTDNMHSETAKARWREIDEAGFDRVHFAWAGADQPGIGHYYRVQGPTFLVEFVNTQPDSAGNPANHIHCLWRDIRGDFGVRP